MSVKQRMTEPGIRRVARLAGGVLAGLLAISSAFFVAAAIVDLAGESETEDGVLAGLLVFFLGVGIGAGYLCWRAFRRRPLSPEAARSWEQCVLELARTSGGMVTVAAVALHCHLSVEESQALLNRLARDGIADPSLSDTGVFEYRFLGVGQSKP